MSIDLSKMPKLGFGLMRLPENDGVIDHEQVCRMVDNLNTFKNFEPLTEEELAVVNKVTEKLLRPSPILVL